MMLEQGAPRGIVSRSFLLSVLVPVVLGVTVGVGVMRLVKRATPAAQSTVQVQPIGSFATTSALMVKVDRVQTDNVGDKNFLPGTDRMFYVLALTIRNTANEAVWVTPVTQAYLRDSSGAKYEMYPAPEDTAYVAGELQAGEQRQGQISFSVPQTATGLKLYYTGESGTDTAIIDLGRK